MNTKTYKIHFGFKDCNKKCYKFAKYIIKTDQGKIIQIIIFQLESTISHFTLHNIEKNGKKRRYHLQEDRRLFHKKDWKNIPRILCDTLPDFQTMTCEFSLQAIPFWRRTEEFTPHILVHDEFQPKQNSQIFDFFSFKTCNQ